MKIPKSVKRDFYFLTSSELHGIGVGIGRETVFDGDGVGALEAWYFLDTHGKRIGCREPELLDRARSGKASWNLQIAQWAEDLADGMLLKRLELREYTKDCPSWVFDATVARAKAMAVEKVGYAPKFLREDNPEIEDWRILT